MKRLINILLLLFPCIGWGQVGYWIQPVADSTTLASIPFQRIGELFFNDQDTTYYMETGVPSQGINGRVPILAGSINIDGQYNYRTGLDFVLSGKELEVGQGVRIDTTGARLVAMPDEVANGITGLGMPNGKVASIQPVMGYVLASHVLREIPQFDVAATDIIDTLLEYANRNNWDVMFDIPGTFEVDRIDLELTSDFEFISNRDAYFQTDDLHVFAFSTDRKDAPDTDLLEALKDKNWMRMSNIPSDFTVGGLVRLVDDTSNGVSRPADLNQVTKISGDTLFFRDDLLFSYEAPLTANEIVYYQPHSLLVENLNAQNYSSTVIGFESVNVVGCINPRIRNCRFRGNGTQLNDGIRVVNSYNVVMEELDFEGLRYGINVLLNHNVLTRNVFAQNLRHVTAVSTFARDLVTKDVFAENVKMPVESHEAFNMTYENVYCYTCTGQYNFRAFGELNMYNVHILTDFSESNSTGNGGGSNYVQLGYHFANSNLTRDFWLVDQTNITIDKSSFLTRDTLDGVGYGSFGGFTATAFNTLTITDSKAPIMGVYEQDSSLVKIDNCTVGRIIAVGRDNLVLVNGTVIDPSISSDTNLSNDSTLIQNPRNSQVVLSDCTIRNAEDYYLTQFGSNFPTKDTTITIQDTKLRGTLKNIHRDDMRFTNSAKVWFMVKDTELRFTESIARYIGPLNPSLMLSNNDDDIILSMDSEITWPDYTWYDKVRPNKSSLNLDFPSTPAGATSVLTATIPGAEPGDHVLITPSIGLGTQGTYVVTMIAPKLAEVTFINNTNVAQDPPATTYNTKLLRQ